MLKQIMTFILLILPISTSALSTIKGTIPSKNHFIIYNQIYKNNSKLEHAYIYKLADIIIKASKKHNLDPKKFSAILAQECRYKLNCINHKSKDYSIGQINIKTIRAYNLDKTRLLKDLDYSVDSAAMVLADFKKRFAHKEKDWHCRYNVGTAEFNTIKDKCVIYNTLVSRFM